MLPLSTINCLVPGIEYTDKNNGLVFPGQIVAPSGKSHTLMAIGTRTMSIFKFNLYMIGLYVEDDAIPAFKQLPVKSVTAASKLLIERNYEWSLRIAPLRNGSLSHLRDALVRRLKQMDDAKTEEIASFSGLLPNVPMLMSSTFVLSYWRGKGVTVAKDGEPFGTVMSGFVRNGLLDIYMNSTTTTIPKLIDDFQDSLENL